MTKKNKDLSLYFGGIAGSSSLAFALTSLRNNQHDLWFYISLSILILIILYLSYVFLSFQTVEDLLNEKRDEGIKLDINETQMLQKLAKNVKNDPSKLKDFIEAKKIINGGNND